MSLSWYKVVTVSDIVLSISVLFSRDLTESTKYSVKQSRDVWNSKIWSLYGQR